MKPVQLLSLIIGLSLATLLPPGPSAHAQVPPTSVTKANLGIKIFPNPVRDMLTLSVENNVHSKVDLIVYNSLGSEMVRKSDSTENSNEVKINISQLKPGIYLLKLTVDNQTFTRSFLKE